MWDELGQGMKRRTRVVHFVGIGGIGMSGIAEVLINLGYSVRGSDLKESDTTRRLSSLGGDIRFGHVPENVEGADVVVVSTAVKKSNVEVVAARAKKVPVIRRAEMLAELMRLKYGIAVGGTHGKTTTTSMIATVLTRAGLDPTVVVGGKLNMFGTNAVLGKGPLLVAEADESDGSFLHLTPTIAVVTNIDAEHLDYYRGGLDEIEDTFVSFTNRIPFYGLAVLCTDHPVVQRMLQRVEKRFVTYGLNPQADYRAKSLTFETTSTQFELLVRGQSRGRVSLRMLGEHNVRNALAAMAVADELGVSPEACRDGIEAFEGVDRRFTIKGEVGGVTVVDDYGHHPEEIRVTLRGARLAYPGRRIVVGFQPHRFTRTRDLFEEFCTSFHEANVLLLSPIYGAGEEPIDGVHSAALADKIRDHGHQHVEVVDGVDRVADRLAEISAPGDLVITFGAGDIWRAGQMLLSRLQTARPHESES